MLAFHHKVQSFVFDNVFIYLLYLVALASTQLDYQGNNPVHSAYFSCNGNESSLLDCVLIQYECSFYNSAYLLCKSKLLLVFSIAII